MKNLFILFVLLFPFLTETVIAQTITTVPVNVANNRFLTEYQWVVRPGLSLNGFDNSSTTSRGLGLKQVLNAAFEGDNYFKVKMSIVLEDAKLNLIQTYPSNDEIEINSRIIQHTAFEALASYVLEKNGISPTIAAQHGIVIRPHAVAMADLRAKLLFVSELDSALT